MAIIGHLFNPSGPPKTLLDNTRWYAKDAIDLIPPPTEVEPIGAQHPQTGWVVAAVERVLAAHDGPMPAKAVHGAVEALLGRSVSWTLSHAGFESRPPGVGTSLPGVGTPSCTSFSASTR